MAKTSTTTRSRDHMLAQGYTVAVVWKEIPGYEGIYEVSTHGHVRSMPRIDSAGHKLKGKCKSAAPDKDGYCLVTLCKNGSLRTFRVHRLVALTFLPTVDTSMQVNHIDGDKKNNFMGNLEWCTVEQNMAHAKSHGLKARGERSGKSVATSTQAALAIAMYELGVRQKQIAETLGLGKSCINHIVRGRCWAHLRNDHRPL